MGLRHPAGHLCGDDGFQQHGILRQLARPGHGSQQVIRQQHAGLVAGHGDELAVLAPHQNTHPVAVRVGTDDEVGAHLVGQSHRQIKALGVLRIGGVHRGERAVEHHLLLHAVQVLHPQLPQSLGHQLPAAAVEGGVDHMEIVRHFGNTLPVVDHSHDILHKCLVRLLAHKLNAAHGHGLVKRHGLHAGEDVDLLQLPGNGVGVLGRKLGAVGPVDLVAVVFLGVVAGGDVDARLTAIVPHGEAQLRGGAQGLENTHMDAVGGADLGGGMGKLHAVVAAVHADGHALIHGGLPLGADDIGKALGGPADDIDIHLVQAHLHGAPQAGGAELQRAVEPALDLLVVACDG